jgi:hypothetical protein
MKVPNPAPKDIRNVEEVFGMEEFDIDHHKRTLEAKLVHKIIRCRILENFQTCAWWCYTNRIPCSLV